MDTHDTLEDVLAGILEDDEMIDEEESNEDDEVDKENDENQINGNTLVPA